MITEYPLSYPIETVKWDGQFVRRMPDENFVPSLKILKSLGIPEVMVTGYVTVEVADFDMMEETRRLGGILDSMGMRPAQHHGLSAMYTSPGTSQDAVIEKLVRSVQYTANMNSPILVIHPGHSDERLDSIEAYDQLFHKTADETGLKELLKLCASNLDAAAEIAQKLGVKIAVENVHLFDTDETLMFGLLNEVKSNAVGFCLDSGHAHYKSPSVLKWMNLLGDKIITTHFHDNRGHTDEHMPPGFGTIPWIDVIKKLREVGYENTVNFESGGWPETSPEKGWEMAINFWRNCEKYASTSHYSTRPGTSPDQDRKAWRIFQQ